MGEEAPPGEDALLSASWLLPVSPEKRTQTSAELQLKFNNHVLATGPTTTSVKSSKLISS